MGKGLTFLIGLEVHKSECLFVPMIYIEKLVAVPGEKLSEFLCGHRWVEVTDVKSI